jgi:hypothetical protein
MKLKPIVVLLALVLATATACSPHISTATPLATLMPTATTPVPTSATASATLTARVAAAEKMWRANLRAGALNDPSKHFANLSRETFNERLRLAAQRYHFIVVRVEMLHPLQDAPLVVVEAKDEHALSASTPAILRLIDPEVSVNGDGTGWLYEGFLFEARNSHGVPFLGIVNWWRGPGAGGGQWAADPSLYPFLHA